MTGTYSMSQSGIGPITIGDVMSERKKFPNLKAVINIYGAQGGYIVEIGRGGFNSDTDLHIIPESEDFDRALGKIITQHQLKQIND